MKSIKMMSFLLIILGSISCSKSDTIIGLNQDIHHDDFAYRVTSFEKRKHINADTGLITAKGIFLIVSFTVENNALRVSHAWDNTIGYVVSGDGNKYENNITAQQMLKTSEPFHWLHHYNTRHGESESTRLVFDIPTDMTNPYLRVRGETLMGDIFDFNRFKRIKIRLY